MVIVHTESDSKRTKRSALPKSCDITETLYNYTIAASKNYPCYITANISASLPKSGQGVTIGTGSDDGNYINAELKPGLNYSVQLVASYYIEVSILTCKYYGNIYLFENSNKLEKVSFHSYLSLKSF